MKTTFFRVIQVSSSVGPSGARALPLGVAAERSVQVSFSVGLSGVRVLPLGIAAERSVHFFWDYFSFFFSPPHIFLPEGVVPGL